MNTRSGAKPKTNLKYTPSRKEKSRSSTNNISIPLNGSFQAGHSSRVVHSPPPLGSTSRTNSASQRSLNSSMNSFLNLGTDTQNIPADLLGSVPQISKTVNSANLVQTSQETAGQTNNFENQGEQFQDLAQALPLDQIALDHGNRQVNARSLYAEENIAMESLISTFQEMMQKTKDDFRREFDALKVTLRGRTDSNFQTQAASGIYWPCETHDDCTAEYSSCSSAISQCTCSSFDIVFSRDFSKCLKTSLIGDQCEDSVQCNLMPTGAVCKSGVCDCADGETYVRGRCRKLNGLNQHCKTDLDCYFGYDRASVQCKENFCTCADGYYHRHGNICRRKSMEIDDACVVDTDCSELAANVKCKSLKCQIVNEIKSDVINNNENNNYTVINNNNTTANKVSNIVQNTHARASRQTSTPTTTYSNLSKSTPSEIDFSVITKLANGLSTTTSSNYIKNYNILSDTDADDLNTESKQEFVSSVATNKSREIAVQTSIDGFELNGITPKVKNVGTTTTASNSSSSRRHSRQQQRQRRYPTSYRFHDDTKTISTLSNTDDDVENQEYGFQCSYNGQPCTGLPHSICSNNICLCRQGYYNKKGKCFAELGEIAESSDECEHQFEAGTKKCICQKNFFYDYNLRGCRKPIQKHLSCTADNQCSPFGASYCPSEIPRRCSCKEYAEYDDILQMCTYKTGLGSECETNDGCLVAHSMCLNRNCICQPNYVRQGDECVPGLGAECLEDDECFGDDSVCATTSASNGTQDQSKTCQCGKGFVHFKDECLKAAENIEEECVESEQCKPLLATCVDKKCACGEKQHFENGHCETRKALQEACSTASECFVEKGAQNIECRNSVCQCKYGYKSDSERRSCVAANKKNSSGRPSALKIITYLLIGSAVLIITAALKQAYY